MEATDVFGILVCACNLHNVTVRKIEWVILTLTGVKLKSHIIMLELSQFQNNVLTREGPGGI